MYLLRAKIVLLDVIHSFFKESKYQSRFEIEKCTKYNPCQQRSSETITKTDTH